MTPDINRKISEIRKKYGCAKMTTINNLHSSIWISENLLNLEPADIALLVEHNNDPKLKDVLNTLLHVIYELLNDA